MKKKHTQTSYLLKIRVIMLPFFFLDNPVCQTWLHNTLFDTQEALPLQNYRGVCFAERLDFPTKTPSQKGDFRSNSKQKGNSCGLRRWMFSYHSRDVFTLHLFNWLKNNHLNWIEKWIWENTFHKPFVRPSFH